MTETAPRERENKRIGHMMHMSAFRLSLRRRRYKRRCRQLPRTTLEECCINWPRLHRGKACLRHSLWKCTWTVLGVFDGLARIRDYRIGAPERFTKELCSPLPSVLKPRIMYGAGDVRILTIEFASPIILQRFSSDPRRMCHIFRILNLSVAPKKLICGIGR